MGTKYTNVALPEDLIREIDALVQKGGLGFTSRGEVVKEAVRRFLMDLAGFKKDRERK